MRFSLIGVVVMAALAASTAAAAQTPDPVVTLTFGGGSMTLATRDVRRIEAPDRVSDGVVKGAIGFGLAGGVGLGLLGGYVCENNCPAYMVKTGLFGAAVGAAAGAIVGGLLDAANPGRQVVFERTSLNIAPVITGRSRSVSVVVRW